MSVSKENSSKKMPSALVGMRGGVKSSIDITICIDYNNNIGFLLLKGR